ncbi:uncharacterized protein LOC120674816 [Panicum virgatum]|uniref:uncharacterized protein LOC120674816 n=1 Tax=Panicum virgatum TaxID=38727 RepID=UPI0019D59C26|nr:uncharacterized protein LOC120674816 [Panicum virgatum]
MGLDYMSLLTPSKAPFYGIVAGNSSTPIGSVTLPVTFGTEQNFWTEYIKFEVADLESSYHAILRRPALAKFMALPHYVYLLLKMPANTGVLSLRGDLLKSFECDKVAIDHAATTRVPSSVSEILAAAKELSLKESMPSMKPSHSSVKPTGDVGTKIIQL